MNKEEVFAVMNANPAFHLGTVEGDQPRVRGMFLYRADENGILFHTGSFKDVHKQIEANPKVELCFNDFQKRIQVRVEGSLEQVEDIAIKDEIYAHPSRAFLKPWRETGKFKDFYNEFIVYRLKSGIATWWTFDRNFMAKEPVQL